MRIYVSLANFTLRMHRDYYFRVLGHNSDTQLDLATQISYTIRTFWPIIGIYCVLLTFDLLILTHNMMKLWSNSVPKLNEIELSAAVL